MENNVIDTMNNEMCSITITETSPLVTNVDNKLDNLVVISNEIHCVENDVKLSPTSPVNSDVDDNDKDDVDDKEDDGDECIDFSKIVLTDEDRKATLSSIFSTPRDQERELLETQMNDYCNQAQEMKKCIYNLLEEKSTILNPVDEQNMNDGDGDQTRNWENEVKEKIDKMKIAIDQITGENVILNNVSSDLNECSRSDHNDLNSKKANKNENGNGDQSKVTVIKKTKNDKVHSKVNENNGKQEKSFSNDDEAKIRSLEINLPQSTQCIKANKKSGKKYINTEQMFKSYKSASINLTEDEKIRDLCEKYIQLLNEKELIEDNSRKHERICIQLIKDKDNIKNELNRSQLIKSRLESLCRELQKSNKVLNESLIEREQLNEKRSKKIVENFQNTLDEITVIIKDNQQRNEQLKNENLNLINKLRSLMDHYENWEVNVDHVLKEKEIQVQLTKSQLAKSYLLLNEEKEKYLTEKHQLINLINELRTMSSLSSENEQQLKAELSMYTSKYEEFQSILSRSNDMFNGVKSDMEMMTKQIRKLEKETAKWKSRSESSNKALVLLAGEKQKRDTEVVAALLKVSTLEKLCRALQEERAQMQEKIKCLQEKSTNEPTISEVNQQLDS